MAINEAAVVGSAIAAGATASTTAAIVWPQPLLIYLVIMIGIIGGITSVINTESINARTIFTYSVSGGIFAWSVTSWIIEKFFKGNNHEVEFSIGIAFIIGLFAHMVILKLIEKKEVIVQDIIDTSTKAVTSRVEKYISNEQKNDSK